MTAIQITIEGKDVTMTYEQARSLFFELGDKIKEAREFQEEHDNRIGKLRLLLELPMIRIHEDIPIHLPYIHDLPFLSGNNDWKEPENDHWDTYNQPSKKKVKQLQLVGVVGIGSTCIPKLPENVAVVTLDDIPYKTFGPNISDLKENMTLDFALKSSKSKKNPPTGGIPWNPRKSNKRR